MGNKREIDDRFKKFGTVAFTLTSKVNDFIDFLEKGQVVASKCKDCGEVGLGEVSSCQNCAGENLEVILLSQNGKLWTYTVIRNRPPGDFKGKVPMGEGLVELPEGIRVKSPLGGNVDKLEIVPEGLDQHAQRGAHLVSGGYRAFCTCEREHSSGTGCGRRGVSGKNEVAVVRPVTNLNQFK